MHQKYFENKKKSVILDEVSTNIKKYYDMAPYKDLCKFYGIGVHKIGKNVVMFDGVNFYNFSKDLKTTAYDFNKVSLETGNHIYLAKEEGQRDLTTSLLNNGSANKKDFRDFFYLSDKFYFKNKTQNRMALAWILISLIPSFLPKLTYLAINGPARHGKTFFVKNIIKPCLQGFLQKSTGDDTRASLEESHNKTTLPIWIEEIEKK